MPALLRILALCLVVAASAPAQESPFVSEEVFRLLNGELSGDISYDHLRHLTLHHSPNGASRGFRAKMRWITERAREFGLEEVRIIDDLHFTGVGWSPISADLWIVSPDNRRLISYDEAAVAIADYSRSGTWEGELIDVGAGTRDSDYQGKDVKGKIVLASGSPSSVMEEAVWKRGALGIVSYNASRGISHPDQISWTRLDSRPQKDNTFAFSVSYRAAMELKQRLALRPRPGSEDTTMEPGERIVVRAKVEAEFEENPKQWIVEGWIRGTKQDTSSSAAQAIVLTAHGQEEKFSANDDNSGCANLLEIARTLVKLMREEKLSRPSRDIRFWWVNEISAPYEYFSAHPEERAKILLNINQDMVGAKQSAGSRIQHITRTPWSRPSALNTVAESIATLVMRGNSAYMTAGQAGSPQPYSRAILSRLGTRERYGAEIVPHFNNTDHMVFNDSIVGIPGITLTNWPDEYIHSTDDDLWQMDATQLKRNAFIVAATTLYFANLGPEQLPALTAHVAADARRMLTGASSRATELLTLASPEQRDAAYLDGVNLIEQTAGLAAATVGSLRAFQPAGQPQIPYGLISLAEETLEEVEEFSNTYKLVSGKTEPPAALLNDEEKAMQAKVPEVAVSVGDYLAKRRSVASTGLHGVMAYETWNFVDGRRSYLDIYRAVKAEAQSAGAWYYGKVTAKQVADLLDAGVKAGFLRLKP